MIRDDANLKSKGHPLKFTIKDIKYLFVENLSEIAPLHDFIQSHLGGYSANDLKVLTSRILSLDDFGRDL